MPSPIVEMLAEAHAELAEYQQWVTGIMADSRQTCRQTRTLIDETRELIIGLDDLFRARAR